MRMPLFTWPRVHQHPDDFCHAALTGATAQLALDRYLGFHYVTNALGGNMMHFAICSGYLAIRKFISGYWPAFGVTRSSLDIPGKVLFGIRALVMATMAIAILSFTVWLHHFFTMGQSAHINAVFGIASMLIGIPTGVKNLRLDVDDVSRPDTLYRANDLFNRLHAAIRAGRHERILLADPGIDYQVHNSGVSGRAFPQRGVARRTVRDDRRLPLLVSQRHLLSSQRALGKSRHCADRRFMLAFFPLYALGLMVCRAVPCHSEPAYVPLEMVACSVPFSLSWPLTAASLAAMDAIRQRDAIGCLPTIHGMAAVWNGRSRPPPPEYNFAMIPQVAARDAFAVAKEGRNAYQRLEVSRH